MNKPGKVKFYESEHIFSTDWKAKQNSVHIEPCRSHAVTPSIITDHLRVFSKELTDLICVRKTSLPAVWREVGGERKTS